MTVHEQSTLTTLMADCCHNHVYQPSVLDHSCLLCSVKWEVCFRLSSFWFLYESTSVALLYLQQNDLKSKRISIYQQQSLGEMKGEAVRF